MVYLPCMEVQRIESDEHEQIFKRSSFSGCDQVRVTNGFAIK